MGTRDVETEYFIPLVPHFSAELSNVNKVLYNNAAGIIILKCWLKSDALFVVRSLASLVLLYRTVFPRPFVTKKRKNFQQYVRFRAQPTVHPIGAPTLP